MVDAPTMSVMSKAKRGRQAASPTVKIVVNARVLPAVVEKIDQLAGEIRPRPTRSEMIAMILEDYAERGGSSETKKKG